MRIMAQKQTSILLMGCFLSTLCLAQPGSKDTTIVVNLSPHTTVLKKKKVTGEENIIKISPLGFVSGSFPLLYERVLNDFISVQAGAGLTSRNYLRGAIQNVSESNELQYPWPDGQGTYDLADPLFNFDHRKPALGYVLCLQSRFYFDSDAPDGAYFGISLDQSRYNFRIPGLVEVNGSYQHQGPSYKEFESVTDLGGTWGYQSVYDRLTLDISATAGLRKVKGNKYAVGQTLDGSGNPTLVEGLAQYRQSLFNFGIGIRVGYHF